MFPALRSGTTLLSHPLCRDSQLEAVGCKKIICILLAFHHESVARDFIASIKHIPVRRRYQCRRDYIAENLSRVITKIVVVFILL